ncbi:HEAT repeat, partial [Trinorchestia longiramus]
LQAEHRGLAAFVLSVMVSNDPENQRKALQANIIPTCLEHISSTSLPSPYDEVKHSYDYEVYDQHDIQAGAGVRMWPAVCLAVTWHNNPEVRWSATRDNAPEKLYPLLLDPVPEVRCACIHALGSFLS